MTRPKNALIPSSCQVRTRPGSGPSALTTGGPASALGHGALAVPHATDLRRPTLALRAFLRGQHALQTDDLLAEHTTPDIQELRDQGIPQTVVNGPVRAATVYDATAAEHGELLRRGRRLHAELAQDFPDAQLTTTQELEDVDPQGMAEGLEQF